MLETKGYHTNLVANPEGMTAFGEDFNERRVAFFNKVMRNFPPLRYASNPSQIKD